MLATLTLLASATESRQSKTGENWPLGQTDYDRGLSTFSLNALL
jgi:hypothetical protein